MTRFPLLAASLAALLLATPAAAQDCNGLRPEAETIAAAQLAGEALVGLELPADMDYAACVRNEVVRRLWKDGGWGGPVGYKVGLTSQAMQERLGIDRPLWGILLSEMLLPDGAEVAADYGARPIAETDLLVVVGDRAINEATTIEEAAAHVTAVKPFIELADLVVAEGEPLTAATVVAINVGARLGIVGPEIPMTPELLAALPGMTVSFGDGSQVFGEAPGSALMGHPLQPLLFLIGELKAAGGELKAGDLVSLGSFGAPQPPRAGATYTARYLGLPGGEVAIRVTFADE